MNQFKQAVILDVQPLFRDLFALMLEKYQLFTSVRTFDKSEDLVDFLLDLGKKEVHIFLDYYLDGETGLSLLSDARRLNRNARVIFVTGATSPQVLQNIYSSKPDAIISKYCDLSSVTEMLRQLDKKDVYMDSCIQDYLDNIDSSLDILTIRETEILKYFAQGYSVNETAEKTYLSKHTVVSHRRNIMAKTKTHSISQLLKYAKENELI